MSATDTDEAALVAEIARPTSSGAEIAALNGSAADAFRAGDYQFAERRTEDPIRRGLALVMIGNPLDGLPLLDRLDPAAPETSEDAACILAYAHWHLGENEEARLILRARLASHPGDAKARDFLDLLEGGPIPFLFETGRPELRESMPRTEGFEATVVAENPTPTEFEERARKARFHFRYDFGAPGLRERPDLAAMPACPSFLYLTDPDVHVLTRFGGMRRFDTVIAATSHHAAELGALLDLPTVSAPFFGGLSATHPSLGIADDPFGDEGERPVDLYFSGAVATPIYHEKPARFFALSGLPARCRCAFHDRTFPLAEYRDRLAAAKFAFVSVRMPGNVNTRAIQALGQGALVLCEAGSGLTDYFPGPEHGVLTYRPDAVRSDIEAHLARYREYRARVAANWPAIRDRLTRLFPDTPRAETLWLRYLAFLTVLRRPAFSPCPEPDGQPGPLDWFTVRGLRDQAEDLRRGLNSLPGRFEALTLRIARTRPAPPAWLDDDGGFAPPAPGECDTGTLTVPRSLPERLLALNHAWVERDRPCFEMLAESVWRDRATGMRLDGWALPDFWLAVFMNRLGLSPGRLYDRAMRTRLVDARPDIYPLAPRCGETDLLVAALGMVRAERLLQRGDTGGAAKRAAAVLECDPDNHAALQLAALCGVHRAIVCASTVTDGAVEDWRRSIVRYPWHFARVLPLLAGRPEIDARFCEGAAHARYLKMVQRMPDPRPLVSPPRIPAGAARYLAWKLGLTEPDPRRIRAALENHDLLLAPDRTVEERVVVPIRDVLAAQS